MELIELKTRLGPDVVITPQAAALLSKHSDFISKTVAAHLAFQARHNDGGKLYAYDVEAALWTNRAYA